MPPSSIRVMLYGIWYIEQAGRRRKSGSLDVILQTLAGGDGGFHHLEQSVAVAVSGH